MAVKSKSETHEFKNVKYLLTSSMRTLILVVLYNNSKSLNEIRDELQKPSATILHGLKELEENNLIKKDKKDYSLTSNGYLLSTNIIKLINNWYSIETHKDFWNNHDLSGIPEEYLNKLYLLKDAELVSSTTSDLSNAFNTYIQLLKTSKNVKMILPIYSENHFKYIIKLLKTDSIQHLTILINTKILQTMRKSRYLKKSILRNKKVTVMDMQENPKIFLTYSEEFMTLTLFFKDKHYDDSQIIVDKSENAIRWAKEVFQHYGRDSNDN
ncbi:MAG: DUF1724 domain-containing protein [Methanobrevibacter sp.]|nr:DUF1724 domain-containing protein [Methanobrevibacter sp.]